MYKKLTHLLRTLVILSFSFSLIHCGGSSNSSSQGPGTQNPPPQTGNSTPPSITSTCSVFPSTNTWNTDISAFALDPNSDNYINFMLAHGGSFVHPDFGSDPTYGIPYTIVSKSQTEVNITALYASQTDPGPYPIPANAPVESGSDKHVLVVDQDNCVLYEMYNAQFVSPDWQCDSGAVFNLKTGDPRHAGWTSADAAGLPIFPGLARYDEVVTQGEIRHALRFTTTLVQQAYIYPATHIITGGSSSTDLKAPPFGLRLRLKAGYDISTMTGSSKVIVTALKKYGMLLADVGSNWYISGSTDTRWDDEDLNQLKKIPGSAFEVVSTGAIQTQ